MNPYINAFEHNGLVYNVHIYLDYELVCKRYLLHIPRKDDVIRFEHGKYAFTKKEHRYGKVKELTWCLDEESPTGGTRVNIIVESLKENEE